MKSFRVVVLFCMCMAALAAFAHQGSMQQPAQTPQTPGAASQNPQYPGATPPYTAPQTQPGAVQNPDTQTPQGAASQAPSMHSDSSGADAQVSALTTALNLNSDQQAKIKTILEDQHQQAVSLVNDPSLSHDAKLQKVHAMRQSTIDRVRATLTTDEQKSKFDNMIQAQNERIHQREQQEQQQPNSTPQPK
jgi:hypothetical protein